MEQDIVLFSSLKAKKRKAAETESEIPNHVQKSSLSSECTTSIATATKNCSDSSSSSGTRKINESIRSWKSLGIADWLINNIVNCLGMKTPTEVQYNTIAEIMKGKDIIASAPTGTGKTAAFALPILHLLSMDPYAIYAIILTPTRELAYQVGEQFAAFGKPIGLKVQVIIGGQDMLSQALSLSKKPHIVVATPGRLCDHLNSNTNSHFSKIKFLVLDEADRLLTNKGLYREVQMILTAIPTQRQTLLFSATMLHELQEQGIQSMGVFANKNPIHVYQYDSSQTFALVAALFQEYIFIPSKVKDCYLVYLLKLQLQQFEDTNNNDDEQKGKRDSNRIMHTIILFTSTCYSCGLLSRLLNELGIKSIELHSQLNQQDRLNALDKFKAGKINVLVATDLANRGLDIPSVELVINYDIPQDVADYIHRIGRTARAGKGGRSVSLVTQHDVHKLHNIEDAIGKRMKECSVEEEAALRHLSETSIAHARATLYLEESDFIARAEAKKNKHSRYDQSLNLKL